MGQLKIEFQLIKEIGGMHLHPLPAMTDVFFSCIFFALSSHRMKLFPLFSPVGSYSTVSQVRLVK